MRKNLWKKVCGVTLTMALAVGALAGCGGTKADNRLATIEAEKKIQVIVDPTFAPYEFTDDSKSGQDQYRGADMELARYIADKIGVELEIVPLEWSAVLAGIAEGKYDMAISGLAYSEERAEAMYLSDPYMGDDSDQEGLVIPEGMKDQYSSLDDFAGKTVAVMSGTTQEGFVAAQIPDAVVKTFDNNQNAVLALLSGSVDAVALNLAQAEMFIEANGGMEVATPQFVIEKSGVCIGIPKGEDELLAKTNEIIAEVVAEGLYEKWFAEAQEEAASLGIE